MRQNDQSQKSLDSAAKRIFTLEYCTLEHLAKIMHKAISKCQDPSADQLMPQLQSLFLSNMKKLTTFHLFC